MTDKSEPARPDNQDPIINFAGEKVALGPLHRGLVPLWQRWSNDFEVMRFYGRRLPTSREKVEEWYQGTSKNERAAYFAVYELADLRPVGYTGLFDIDQFHRIAEFDIFNGDKDCWGKGYGTEISRLMLDYGFTCLGLHNIFLKVHSANEPGIRAYQRAGYRMAGRLRQTRWLGDRAYDMLLMDCLATEFQSQTLYSLLPEDPQPLNKQP